MFIPDYIVKRLDAIDIFSLAERLGIHINNKRKALCFMHNDHHPSFSFYKKTNTWRCWVCGIGGGCIELVMRYYGLNFQDACLWLAKTYGITIPYSSGIKTPKIKIQRFKHQYQIINEEKPLVLPDQDIYNWIIEVSGLHDFAKDFLFNERKYTEEAVYSAKIKSMKDTGKFITSILKKFGEERCISSKILWRSYDGWHCCFDTPCLLFPYYGTDGKIYHIQSRYMGQNGKTRFNGPSGESTLMFNLPVLNTMDRYDNLYIAEGVTDCLAFLSEGKKAVALPGAHSYKDWFSKILKDYTLFMYVDNDKPGKDLLSTINKGLKRFGTSVHDIRFDNVYHDYSDRYTYLVENG